MSCVTFRNVTRYVRDVKASLPLYQALGFALVRHHDGMAVLQNEAGLKLILHVWNDHQGTLADTAIGLTIEGSVEDARAYLEGAGFRCLREPEASDEGFFYIYGDLDGNPVNLVGRRRHA